VLVVGYGLGGFVDLGFRTFLKKGFVRKRKDLI
jgi:hypothetical protein